MWTDIACVVFSCVTANHLGLIKAVEDTIGKDIPVVNCPKCFSFWSVMAYMTVTGNNIITTLAISFLASYAAIWLELSEGIIDTIYLRLYGTFITNNNTDAAAADDIETNTIGSVPELRQTDT